VWGPVFEILRKKNQEVRSSPTSNEARRRRSSGRTQLEEGRMLTSDSPASLEYSKVLTGTSKIKGSDEEVRRK
jgi:hypothetical protein